MPKFKYPTIGTPIDGNNKSNRIPEKQMGGDSPTTTDHGDVVTISAVHPDILHTHIFTRLDGPTLATAACTSSQFHALSTQQKLWLQICNSTWPSTADPLVRRLISAFPACHRSFYSDSFLAVNPRSRSQPFIRRRHRPPSPCIISAVDIKYQDQIILSRAHVAETGTDPFRINLLDPKETIPMKANLDIRDTTCLSNLQENLTLSWILIDPTRNRAANVSSRSPVLVKRDWLSNDVELLYATVLSDDRRGELVQCLVVVTCGGGGELVVREVRLHVEDMEGKKLGWKVLEAAVEGGRKRRGERGEEREMYKGWRREERERKHRKRRRENRREMMFMVTNVVVLLSFWAFVAMKFLQLSWFYAVKWLV